MRTLAFALAVLFASAATNIPAHAEDYPSHPIRLIVPFAAGGAADAVARILGKRVGDALGQSIVVEDRGGGAGIIGTEAVKNAEPDGYTLLSVNPGRFRSIRASTPSCLTIRRRTLCRSR